MIIMPIFSKRNDFEQIWSLAIRDFKTWISGLPAPISPLTRNMELLRRICSVFKDDSIRNNDNIQKLLLDKTVENGGYVEISGIKYLVIGRNITERGGILYELRDEHGNVKQHEFFE